MRGSQKKRDFLMIAIILDFFFLTK